MAANASRDRVGTRSQVIGANSQVIAHKLQDRAVQKAADCFVSPVKRKKANLELPIQPGRSHLDPPCARHCAEAVRGLSRGRGAANARLHQPAIMVRGQPSGAYDDRTTLDPGFGADDQHAGPQPELTARCRLAAHAMAKWTWPSWDDVVATLGKVGMVGKEGLEPSKPYGG
jgi:hypothetical protein